MIIVNPNLKGKNSFEPSKKYFPHLFDENGRQIEETFIYSRFNDIIIESIEDAKTIKQKAESFIKHEIKCLEIEILTQNKKLNELKSMLEERK